jgi:hypothetical protein
MSWGSPARTDIGDEQLQATSIYQLTPAEDENEPTVRNKFVGTL